MDTNKATIINNYLNGLMGKLRDEEETIKNLERDNPKEDKAEPKEFNDMQEEGSGL